MLRLTVSSGWRRLDLRSSVYARGILFITFVCLALLSLDLKQSWTARGARLQEARIETKNLARSLAQHAQDVFEATDVTLKGLRDTINVEGRDPAATLRIDRRMQVRVANQRLLHGVFLFDENGNWLASSLNKSDYDKVRSLNYAEREFFKYHRQHSDDVVLVGTPIQAKLDQTWVVTVSRRISKPDGSFGGVVDAAIGIDLFQNFFETFDIGRGGAITLVSRQGIVMVRRPFGQNNVGRSVAQAEFFRNIQDNMDSGSFEFTSLIDGTPRLGSFQRVPGFDLIMIVALDKNEILATWWYETKVHLVWSVAAIVLAVFLGYRLILQIRDRVFAETVAQKLLLEADQRDRSEAERKKHQGELEGQKWELERSNAALEQFAYAASHDLQSPLRAVAHLAQWIDEDVRPTASPETVENLGLLNGRVARLQMLISGLLAYARVGCAEPLAEDVSVPAAVHDVVQMLEPRPGFVVACEGAMSTIRILRTPFELVLKNLISNAQQHHDRAVGRVSIAMRLFDGMVEIRVSDDGPGIDARYHDEIFVIFKTLQSRDDTESGGIGLAMVKKQVTANGGLIWVESAPPARGTTFVVTWKLAAP